MGNIFDMSAKQLQKYADPVMGMLGQIIKLPGGFTGIPVTVMKNPTLKQAKEFMKKTKQNEIRHTGFVKYEISELGYFDRNYSWFKFNNGSKLYFGYAEKEKDVHWYAAIDINLLAFDKKEDFMDFQVDYMRTRVRLGCWKPSELDKDSMPRELDSAAL